MRPYAPLLECIAVFVLSIACAAAIAAGGDPSRDIFPGAKLEPDGTVVLTQEKVLRIPGTSKERTVLAEGTRVAKQESIKVRAQGKMYDVEMWAGEDIGVLAVFPAGATAPTDVADVQTDRTPYLGTELISLGGDDAFAVSNSHHNSGESFNQISLFHLRDGRLRRIAVVGANSAVGGCGKSYSDELHWLVEPQEGGLPTIIADVETTHSPKDFPEDCRGRRGKEWREHVRSWYVWDVAKDRYVEQPRQPGPRKP
jgi:hypothetical protein